MSRWPLLHAPLETKAGTPPEWTWIQTFPLPWGFHRHLCFNRQKGLRTLFSPVLSPLQCGEQLVPFIFSFFSFLFLSLFWKINSCGKTVLIRNCILVSVSAHWGRDRYISFGTQDRCEPGYSSHLWTQLPGQKAIYSLTEKHPGSWELVLPISQLPITRHDQTRKFWPNEGQSLIWSQQSSGQP